MQWIVSLALVAQLVCAASGDAAEPGLRLRIAWGGGADDQWQAAIRLTEGELWDVRPLGIEADEPGSMWLDAGQVIVRERSPRAYDGLDVSVRADLGARLTVSLSPKGAEEPRQLEVTLKDLLSQGKSLSLDDTGNRLLVTRAPGDKLRVEFARPSLVFAPGEPFQFRITPNLLGVPAETPLQIKAQLVAASSEQKISSQEFPSQATDDKTPADPIPVEIKLPDAEGVYDLVISAINPSLSERLPWKKPLAERRVQLIVVDTKAPAAGDGTLAKVLEIDPANPRWWERLPSLPLLPALRKGPLGNGDAVRWEHPTLGPLIQLEPAGHGGIGWEAYPLPINSPGQPHVLEIEYPTDVPQTLGLSILEPNAAGAVTPLGLDSGVFVSDEEADSQPQLARHRIVFWPRTKTPLLLVTNRRPGARAVYGKIRVLSTQHEKFSPLTLGRATGAYSPLPRATPPAKGPGERLMACYLDRPLFAKNFLANESLDAPSHRSLDDWTTFHQGAMRLTEYLNYVGYNGLMIGVVAEGGAIYPSRCLEPTPRYDTGVFFASGQDPVQKDVLELLFRVFDREHLQLIPAVRFSTPLPALERLAREEGPAGIRWIGADGRPWLDKHPPRQGNGGYYNPLDPRVQQAMLEVVRELTARYGHHPSFGGLAIQLSADGYAQLPSFDGGYDDETVARFQRDLGPALDAGMPKRFGDRVSFLGGPAAAEWYNWRADVLYQFHRRLQKEVAGAGADAKLYLAGATMLDSPQLQRTLRPALPPMMKVDDVLLGLGIRPGAYRAQRGLVLLRPQRTAPPDSLEAQAVDLELNLSPEVDRLFGSQSTPGSLFYHEPQKARLASFDAKSPFGAANTFTRLISQIPPSGDHNRRRFIHSLATLDAQSMFDGGWLLAMGQEDAVRELAVVYRQLPAGQFETVANESQPVTIRTRTEGRTTFAYLVNDSPWKANVMVLVDMPSNCPAERLGTKAAALSLARGSKGVWWTVDLAPYELVGAKFSAADVRLSHPRVVVDEKVPVALQRRIQDLGARAAALGNPIPLGVLENPGFELGDDQQLAGWKLSAQEGLIAQLDPQVKHSGERSLRFASTEAGATLQSAPFDPPPTGRVAVTLWLRVADASRQPTLRLAIEGRLDDGEFYRFAEVGGRQPGSVEIATQFTPFVFQVDDLPATGLADLRVRFDLIGPGEIWIDDVQVSDLTFSENERVELAKLITLANFKLQAGQIGDCARLLEGYWPQFLVANVPLQQAPAAVAERPRRPNAEHVQELTPAPTEKRPGMFDRVKDLVPKFKRKS